MSKNIEMNYKIDSGYEVIYPNVQTNSVTDISNYYYDKTQVDGLIQESKDYTDGLSFKKNLICESVHFSLNKSQVNLAQNVSYVNVVGLEVILENLSVTGSSDLSLYLQNSGTETSFSIYTSSYDNMSPLNYKSPVILWFSEYGQDDDSYGTLWYQYRLSNGDSMGFPDYTGNTLILRSTKSGVTFRGDITIYSLIY